MISTYSKFNGKYCKKKFGTLLGSIIFPILADILIKDLKNVTIEKSDFDLPPYFQFIDHTFLNTIMNVLFLHNYRRKLIKKHIKIRIL